MGSCSNYSALERYCEKLGEELEKEWSELLIGRKIVSCSETVVDYWIKNDVELDDGSSYECHYSWASQGEDNSGIENMSDGGVVLTEEDSRYCMPMKEYFTDYIIGNEITKVSVGYDRDDMVYLYASVGENENTIEIPIMSVEDIKY